MILADTSAWVEYLRRTGSDQHLRMRDLIGDGDLVITEVVVMELLAGVQDADRRERLRRLLYRFGLAGVTDIQTYEQAADVFRACRAGGHTIRKMTDCLIAAVAIREGAELLHHDRDFDVIAEHSSLRIAV